MAKNPFKYLHRNKHQKLQKLLPMIVEFLEAVKPTSARSVYYHLWLNGKIAKGSEEYLGLLTWARFNGLIPWEWIVDETRELERASVWGGMDSYLKTVLNYRRDPWLTQPRRLEVWSEKAAFRSVLKDVLDEYAVGFRVFHGDAGNAPLHDVSLDEKPLDVLYVGDHDPSGLNMSEVSLPRRLAEHAAALGRAESDVSVTRIATTRHDLQSLPTLPLTPGNKLNRWYVEHTGLKVFCELDAMDPRVLRDRLRGVIERISKDRAAWRVAKAEEKRERAWLKTLPAQWKRNGRK